jgi:hypothetical protein
MVVFLVKGKQRLGQNASASRGCYSVVETPTFKTRFGLGPFARILAAPRQAPRKAPSAYPTASADPAPADGMHQRAGRPEEVDMGIRLPSKPEATCEVKADPYPPAEDSIRRLHRSGWICGERALRRQLGPHRLAG